MNDLTIAAILAERKAAEAISNIERIRAWATRWLQRFGHYPKSLDAEAVDERLEAAQKMQALNTCGQALRATAQIYLHPTFEHRRRPWHSNHGVVRVPRYRGQIKHIKLPQPPAA